MKILHIDSSIQAEASASRLLSAAIVAQLKTHAPAAAVTYRDLAADPLPHLTLARFGSAEGEAVLEEFLSADVVVIGVPMYNFGIPSQLKAWFDHILIAGRTFRYTETGPEGLAGDKRVIVAASRGGYYGKASPGEANEHAESHLRAMLGFAGITAPEIVIAEGVAIGPEHRQQALDAALAWIDDVAPIAATA
ncbi:FMN-dependent NADH-azoreductase [Novosphingobium sp. PS1R-30]|uniref:FMN dependent NADH:quinone oxidoreductase n=1 Tax=Novosphingobium anseongense TaxID=3133436 RepID=A0ABU8RZ01_9SPHN